jgi:hypothetical protein
MYRVLWLDDECEKPEMIQFKIDAENQGLFLDGFRSFEEGFIQLDKKIDYYDIILLDGLFLEKRNQESGTEDESGIGMAIARINELKNQKVFPWFVLSGKDKFTKGENSLLKGNKARCFDKTNPHDLVQLFKEMKIAADAVDDYKLKSRYQKVLEVCSTDFLGEENYSRIFTLIKHINNDFRISSAEDMLNPIRKIIEKLFAKLAEYEIIPSAITTSNGWINNSSKFLSNKHTEYEQLQETFPRIITENVYRLLNMIQDASHSEGDLKLKVDLYLKNAQSDYLYRSIIYLLFDLVLWFKEYVIENKDLTVNKSRWRIKLDTPNWIEGTILQIKSNGWADFIPASANTSELSIVPIGIPPNFVTKFSLKINEVIKIMVEPSSDGLKQLIKNISKQV